MTARRVVANTTGDVLVHGTEREDEQGRIVTFCLRKLNERAVWLSARPVPVSFSLARVKYGDRRPIGCRGCLVELTYRVKTYEALKAGRR